MLHWIERHIPEVLQRSDVLLAIGIGSLLFAILSLVLVGWLLVRIPADYFVRRDQGAPDIRRMHWRFLILLVIKNIAGVLLILLGVMLSLPGIPGQGILTILVGVMLVSFRGKRKVQLWILRRRGVLSTINRIRKKAGREPLQLEAPDQKPSDS